MKPNKSLICKGDMLILRDGGRIKWIIIAIEDIKIIDSQYNNRVKVIAVEYDDFVQTRLEQKIINIEYYTNSEAFSYYDVKVVFKEGKKYVDRSSN